MTIRDRINQRLTEGTEKSITTASVNKYLKSKGVKERLYRGNGYYYFGDGDAHKWPEASVYVNHISQIRGGVEAWYDEWKSLHDKWKSSHYYSGDVQGGEDKPYKLILRKRPH